ncbi:MAG: hypothetical protein ABFQ95_07020 [Pseudomonadota bacterium]
MLLAKGTEIADESLWDEWMKTLYLTELTGEGELPGWALGSSVVGDQ